MSKRLIVVGLVDEEEVAAAFAMPKTKNEKASMRFGGDEAVMSDSHSIDRKLFYLFAGHQCTSGSLLHCCASQADE